MSICLISGSGIVSFFAIFSLSKSGFDATAGITCICNVLITIQRYRQPFVLKTHLNNDSTQKSFMILLGLVYFSISVL